MVNAYLWDYKPGVNCKFLYESPITKGKKYWDTLENECSKPWMDQFTFVSIKCKYYEGFQKGVYSFLGPIVVVWIHPFFSFKSNVKFKVFRKNVLKWGLQLPLGL